MDINEAFKRRIEEIKDFGEEDVAKEKFAELWLLFSKTNKEFLKNEVIENIQDLRAKIEITGIKKKLKEAENKERKIKKVDNFNDLCNLMKYSKFDEAIKKFNERRK